MRKLVVLAAAVMLPLALMAQEGPKAEVFGGYSLLRNSGNNLNGWNAQGTLNFTPHFGITTDFSGNYHTVGSFSPLTGTLLSANQRVYTFLAGPRVSTAFDRFSVFGHSLFGVAHSSLGAGVTLPIVGGISTGLTSANAFAMALGGGVDIELSRHVAVRAGQLDYLYTRFSPTDAISTGLFSNSLSGHQNSFRYSTGIVFRF
ncbi:MAG: outer membrane beta-barrel protein [Acidobacteriales bacterium]|nr:outer membrane beta-barrel protein [Terriglobales bacterium]